MGEILTTRRAIALGLTSSVTLVALVAAWAVLYSPQNEPALSPSDAAFQVKPADKSAAPRAPEPSIDKQAVKEATSAIEALTKTLEPSRIKPSDNSGGAPVFDVARIGPKGDAVIAGRAAPGASIELLRDGIVHDKAVADRSGEFVIVPGPLPPGDYSLTLRATQSDGTVLTSKSSVAVSLHADKAGEPVAARPEPKKPASEVASGETRKSAEIRIVAVESQGSGNLYVSGQTEPGGTVRLYLNGSYIASATASPAGLVAFAIEVASFRVTTACGWIWSTEPPAFARRPNNHSVHLR